ncbi:XRE family transcriptional regulator [Streptomyces cinerochromogenes]|uniref:XRE family transcriptional regulator n=1 Tax=Streptomyces cinerochromogenes TaxID=66422 RepID=UPI0033B53B80
MPRWKALPEDLEPQIKEFTGQLRELVDRSGLSIAALADRTGYSRTSWERYLDGRLLAPKGAVIALAEATGSHTGHLTTLWELAERAWTRAELRHDHTMDALRVAEARAALGDLAAAVGEGASARAGGRAGAVAGAVRPPGVSPTIPAQPTGSDAGVRDSVPRGKGSGGDSRTGSEPADAPPKNSWGLAGYRGPSRASARPAPRPPADPADTGPDRVDTLSGRADVLPGRVDIPSGRADALPGRADTPPGLADTPSGPTGTPGLPAGTPGSPTGTPGLPARTPGSPTGTPGLPARTPGSPTGTPGLPARTPGSPAGTPGSPAPTSGTPGPHGAQQPAPSGRWRVERQQVVMFLAGLVGAGALIAGVFLFTHRDGDGHRSAGAAKSAAPSASARTSPPPGVKCTGSACTGKDAEAMGCSGELVTTAKTATVGTTTLEVRYSKTCGTAWGRITGGSPGDTVRVTVGKARQAGDITAAGDTIGYTPMVAVRDPAQARACATLATGQTGCTE